MDGYVGAVVPPPVTIHCAKRSYADWMLTAELPGDARPGNDLDELKAEAERWLERFVSSLGAVFAPLCDRPSCERPITGEPAADPDDPLGRKFCGEGCLTAEAEAGNEMRYGPGVAT